MQHQYFMNQAIEIAREGYIKGQVPIGAVIVHNNIVIARAHNGRHAQDSKIAHAEIEAIRSISTFLVDKGHECTIYTTLEPCTMCLGAIAINNISSVYFGAMDKHAGSRNLLDSMRYLRKKISVFEGEICREECEGLIIDYDPTLANLFFRT